MNISIIIRSLLLIAFSTIIRADDQLTTSAIVHIYPNFAEILQSVPEFASSSSSPKNIVKIEFNEDEWNDIRADTLMLTVNHHDLKSEDMNLSVTSEAITEKKKSTNGETIFLSDLQNKTAPLIEAKMIDEIRQLIFDVKQQLYYTISPNEHRILYKTLPEIKKYIVTFTYNQSPVVKIPRSSLYVAYLYAKLKWKTQYQLLLFSEKNRTAELTIFANIQNDGMKTIAIDAGQLLSGDINIQMVKWLPQTMPIHHDARQRTHVSGLLGGSRYAESYSPPPPIISSSGQELAGVYRYTIDNPFIIEPKTQFLLPMIKSNVKCERFGLIDQVFSVTKTNSEGR
ncbi:unnamed protein product [Didymodactylos carnosus]|uniref:Uncharacterized protein n=1 Tax=Didymodactylos carnosus TaxID=1234261 RepID=A0A815GNR1_9BILA|nr:unnamed protein product [Didymodactylos carnosus]CAF1391650.1 unnamed protein product [Didymodactylos carnosus]CAF4199292.1 unnamed protein product [Didymodactylos carnosus]CAF4201884.1 unnamed protein product [Didymodactylos carnosus]